MGVAPDIARMGMRCYHILKRIPFLAIITRQAPVVVLLAAMLMQTLNRGCIVWSYYINSASYAKNCENKAKPQMHCNGKCQMMKKLKQEEKKDAGTPERRSVQNEIISSKSFFPVVTVVAVTIRISFPGYKAGAVTDRSYDCFRPPGMA